MNSPKPLREAHMGNSFLLAGGVIGLAGMLVFIGIRYRVLSVVQATIVMTIISAITGAVMELSLNSSDTIGATCTASLGAVIFGFWTFVFGRMFEQWLSRQQK